MKEWIWALLIVVFMMWICLYWYVWIIVYKCKIQNNKQACEIIYK